ncbi:MULTISPECIES: aminotransferase class V-fold PLP-dependent enzyme [Thermoanaerobacter]|jgi:cysteine desulfurase family protein|uniref:cysteine desulfurase n=2 Tax=Thermoanaerobacter TaxID=1754 RepID=B0K8H2_THEP3|nr:MULTISPECIES: aminotransferase class V-fold PLP-dependent enzyme [Thermoanaerobacter]ABY95904.1 cysteine desulfurase family protein [Thermoanaerobacter pseudethanolicus ATCC 33223]ADV80830.1 cysteine desulfurase family protein [Thermoanaerobacter brockii subsp. finnii Ako-1]KUJ89871.1 MAG: cysteine desulfurase [Thermoanaerobacter thermocopriae]HBW59669.1 aminotransferase class V-fold PLP-dependent enzyme [Thermoanaerobacter sp.]
MIYFDNAATSWPKPEEVYREVEKVLRNCGNPGRGGHKMALESGRVIFEARQEICSIFNIKDPMRVVFTSNTTEALNIALKGILKEGDHVITSSMEHNSMIRPLMALKEKGIEVTIVKANEEGKIDPEDIKEAITKKTKMIAITHASNVTGTIMPIEEIGNIAREMNLIFLVDAAQTVGVLPIDVEKQNIDLLAFPGHKGLYGPQGTGGLYVRKSIEILPLEEGGTGSKSESMYQPDLMPDKLESGTPNTPGIAGLKEGVKFVKSVGIKNIYQQEKRLTKILIEGLKEIKGVKIYGPQKVEERVGVVSITLKDSDVGEISYILDRDFDIATRAGLHCAPLAHSTIGTLKTGTLRFGIGYFNTEEEVEKAIKAIEIISQKAF